MKYSDAVSLVKTRNFRSFCRGIWTNPSSYHRYFQNVLRALKTGSNDVFIVLYDGVGELFLDLNKARDHAVFLRDGYFKYKDVKIKRVVLK
jgi:hypothetical protein